MDVGLIDFPPGKVFVVKNIVTERQSIWTLSKSIRTNYYL